MSRMERAMEDAARLRAASEKAEERRGVEAENTSGSFPAQEYTSYERPLEMNVSTESPFLVTVNDPFGREAEEYRKLKTVIAGFSAGSEFLNTIMVTSSLGGEGKSITALNLAISLAHECDHTVLLIDADLRKPSLHNYLGLEIRQGLADCLVDGTDVGEAFIKTGIGKLSFLPSGRRLENPAEMLSSQKMRNLMTEMKHRYRDRYLILDAPPVLPVAETRSLAALVDGVVFVVREGVPSREDVVKARDSLRDARIAGVVYNGASTTPHAYGYRYAYGGYGQNPSARPDAEQNRGLLNRMFKRG